MTYDKALREEKRLKRLYDEAQKRRHDIEKEFARHLGPATTKMLHFVFGITELRDAIFAYLLPGEIAAFLTASKLRMNRLAAAAAQSPFKVILPDAGLLKAMYTDGYNLTIIGDSKHALLNGLSGSPINCNGAYRPGTSQHWSAILIASKDNKFVPCTSVLLPASAFGCVGVEADAVGENIDETGGSRVITLKYGQGLMSIWLPTVDQPTTLPLAVPQKIFHSHVRMIFRCDWRWQPHLYYAHLRDDRSLLRGPMQLVDAEISHREEQLFDLQVDIRDVERGLTMGKLQYRVL